MTSEQVGNAAIEFSQEAYDTSGPTPVGRQSAGESFLGGWLRHARAEQLHVWSTHEAPPAVIADTIRKIGKSDRQFTVLPPAGLRKVAAAGNLFSPGPSIVRDIWVRSTMGADAEYGLCGITHTIAVKKSIDDIANLLIAPTKPWDRLICTSDAGRAAIETCLDAVAADLTERLGATRLSHIQCETIPLGIDVASLQPADAHRARWRAQFGIPADAFVVLYLGRLNPFAKMNPAPMAMAMERAARTSRGPIYWIVAGWAPPALEAEFHRTTQAFCPSVHYRHVDTRLADVRSSIWSAADAFMSLSDNIQETFGLTPLEAMAAGLPVIVSDWDGYRETVRHGKDGFRIRTTTMPPGAGEELALRYAADIMTYDRYAGAVSQLTAVDVAAAAEAITTLAGDPARARRMGAAAQHHVRANYDWSVIIPRYEAMWADMTAHRVAASGSNRQKVRDPRRLDPFCMFASYPTDTLAGNSRVGLAAENPNGLDDLLTHKLITFAGAVLPTQVELRSLIDRLTDEGEITVDALLGDDGDRAPTLARGLMWLAKYGVVTIRTATPAGD